MHSKKLVAKAPRPFRTCPMCRFAWREPADFIRDSGLRLIGHQSSSNTEHPGQMMFLHSCGATLTVVEPEVELVQAIIPEQQPRVSTTSS